MEDSARFGSVVTERYRVAVVDVPNGHADDVRSEAPGCLTGNGAGISRKTKIEKTDTVSGRIQRGRDAGEAVGYNRIRLPLAIRANEKHACPAIATDHTSALHDLHLPDCSRRLGEK